MDLSLRTALNFCLLCLWLMCQNHVQEADSAPREYRRRQVLPHIPGYIPVYIQHGDKPPSFSQQIYRKSTPPKYKTRTKPLKTGERFRKPDIDRINRLKQAKPSRHVVYKQKY